MHYQTDINNPDSNESQNNTLASRTSTNTCNSKQLKEIRYYAIFNSIAPSIDTTSNFVNVVILANKSLSTSALISAYQNLITTTCCAMLSPSSSIVSNAYGHRFIEINIANSKIRHTFKSGFLLALTLSIPGVISAIGSRKILQIMQQPEDLLNGVQDYFFAYAWGMPAIFIVHHEKQIALGLSDINSVNAITLFDNVSLSFLGYLLVNGKFGLPEMGIAGLGYALTITNWLDLIFFSTYLKFGAKFQEYNFNLFSEFKEVKQTFKELISLSTPVGIQVGSELLIALAYSALVGKISTDSLSAYQISNQYVLISGIPVLGLVQSAIILVGREYGAARIREAHKIANICIGIGGGISLLFLILMPPFSKELMRPFIDIEKPENEEIIKNVPALLLINAIAQIFDAIRNITAGSIQSAFKDTRISMLIGLLNFGLIGLSLGYLLGFTANFGVKGICIGRSIGLALAGSELFAYWIKKSNTLSLHQYSLIREDNTNIDVDTVLEQTPIQQSDTSHFSEQSIEPHTTPVLFSYSRSNSNTTIDSPQNRKNRACIIM